MNIQNPRYCLGLLFLICLMGTGCVSQTVKSTSIPSIESLDTDIPEEQLLDVGIAIFDPGLDGDIEEENIFPEIRRAEARFIPYTLMEAIQSSGSWGAVRVVLSSKQIADLMVSGTILNSDGEVLELHVRAQDATGRVWLDKDYRAVASRYSYEGSSRHRLDPFQAIYNTIANDLLDKQQLLNRQQALEIRMVSELLFARSFSPEAFSDYLSETPDKQLKIHRLPAENDPMLKRVRKIRERDHLFIDTMQEHYTSFNNEMSQPYQEWRKQTYSEAIALRELKSESTKRMIVGVASIIGGIAAANSDNRSTRAAANVAMAGGGYMVKSGFDKRAEAEIHVEALEELSTSLEAEVTPKVITLEDRSVVLSGSVEDQYQQWRSILRSIYETEVGSDNQPRSANS